MEIWTAITKEKLKALYWDQGMTVKAIADMFGLGSESVRKKMARMEIQRRPRGAEREFNVSPDELRKLYQQMPMRKIAKLYGVGDTVVWSRLREYGIKLEGYEDGGHSKKGGRVFTESHKKAMSLARRAADTQGPSNPNWRGGAALKNWKARQTSDHRDWRKAALDRAGHKCEGCGVKQNHVCECCGTKTRLHVHHVEPFATVIDKRHDPENSEVLCPRCHTQRHKGKIG